MRRLYWNRFFLFPLLFVILFDTMPSFAQTKDSNDIDQKKELPHLQVDTHISIAVKEGISLGLREFMGVFLLGLDADYNILSNNYLYSISFSLGWVPSWESGQSFFFPLISTISNPFKEVNTRYLFLSANVGWLSIPSKSITYSFAIGPGIEVSSTTINSDQRSYLFSKFFIHLQASLGFSLF
jgi:hypothetical protein